MIPPGVGTHNTKEHAMDEDRIAGSARNVGGKVQEGVGRLTGDVGTQAKGVANQIGGSAQDLYGQAQDSASAAMDRVGEFIKQQPYTAAAIALGLGWLLGRMHRPL
jgi:uncharacterized protein YjbJ (UPF0337 family)